MSGHLDHNLAELPALVLDGGEQVGLRGLLHDVLCYKGEHTTVALERRGLTNPLIATVDDPGVGEATFLIAAGTFAELGCYPARDERLDDYTSKHD